MYCPKCGTHSNDTDNWCVNCGYNFSNIPERMRGVSNQNNDKEEILHEPADKEVETVAVADVQEEMTENSEYAASEVGVDSAPKAEPVKNKVIKDHFTFAILMAILCSIAFGAAAVIFSGMTQAEIACGDLKKADIYSGKAKLFCNIALAVGIVKYIFIAVFVVCGLFNMFVPAIIF